MTTIEKFSSVIIIAIIGLVIAGLVGYVMNIYKAFSLDFKEPYTAEILRIGGVVVPFVGAIGGYVDVGN